MPADGRGFRLGGLRRLAFVPARAAARASRGPFETATDEHIVPELTRIVDRALAGSLPEDLAESVIEHRVLERVAAELAASGALDRAVESALASPKTGELTDRIVKSDEMKRAIKEVVASPEVRAAIMEQGAGFAGDLADDLRSGCTRLDDRIEKPFRRSRPAATRFGGLASRAIVLVVDALLIAIVFAVVVAVVGLVSYLVGGLRPKWLVGTLIGIGWALIATGYLVFFWSGPGRTPGMSLMHLRLRNRAGETIGAGRAFVRVIATWLSIVPCFLGYVTVLFDTRRRGLPDLVTGTEVVREERV
jgi:uncharacterized RDD family membrane protein YckC